jgi:putative oxidoreductase
MFSMFPDGWPGVGLLLLRGAAGVVLLAQGVACFCQKGELGFVGLTVASVMSVAGLLLLVGVLTRLVGAVAVMACIGSAFSWSPGFKVGLLVTPPTAALSAVIAVAVVCLGPGAFSLDARLFGRREIIIPTGSSEE